MTRTALAELIVDGTVKGLPQGLAPIPLRRIGEQGWNLLREDLPLPAAILKRSIVAHNSDWMRRFLALSGAKLCPHGKTTMAPQLFHQQLDDGAWGITLATMQQVRAAREFGISRILLANELLGRTSIDWVLDELQRDASFEFYCLVDSVAGVERLVGRARERGATRSLDVLVEVGVPGKRCGCRDVESAMAVARAVKAAAPWLRLSGIEGFEGVITGRDDDDRDRQVREFLAVMVAVARGCDAEDLFAPGKVILTAGGSCFYDMVLDGLAGAGLSREVELVIRSGCYLTHDSAILNLYYEQLLQRCPAARDLGRGLQPALEVWSYVMSRPEPTRVILGLGKRDASFDADLPLPVAVFRPGRDSRPRTLARDHRVVGLNDQHALLDVPADSDLAVGDMVACGISHPCTTFDRWQFLAVVDDDYNVVDGVRTFF